MRLAAAQIQMFYGGRNASLFIASGNYDAQEMQRFFD
jgi:hypothetical protein